MTTTYLDDMATRIRSEVPPEYLPDEDTSALFRLYALLALAKGTDVTTEDVHNAWAAWMQERDPQHRSLKPFGALDAATQEQDQPYAQAIRRAVDRGAR